MTRRFEGGKRDARFVKQPLAADVLADSCNRPGRREAATVQLVAIWVALGALAAIIPAMLNAPLWVQFVVFVLVSAVAIVATVRW